MAKKDLIKILIVLAILLAVFLPGFSKHQRLLFENRSLKGKITELEKSKMNLLGEIRLLKTDPVYVEGKAREKMGVVKKGEIIYRVVPEEQTAKTTKK